MPEMLLQDAFERNRTPLKIPRQMNKWNMKIFLVV